MPRAARLLALSLILLGSTGDRVPARPPESPAEASEIINAAIRYHDPGGRWFRSMNHLDLKQTRPGGYTPKFVSFTLYPTADRFRLSFKQDGFEVSGSFDGDDCTISPEKLSEEQSKRFQKFDCDGLRWWQGYYGYLFNSPMNLRDEGGEIDPVVVVEPFEGVDAYRVTVRYGHHQPVWEHFVDVKTHRVLGCRFSTGGERKDGEMIVYEGEVESGGIRLPQTRSWYLHTDGSLIGVDHIESYSRAASSK